MRIHVQVSIFLALLLLLTGTACKKGETETAKASDQRFVVINTSTDVRVIRSEKTLNLAIGMILKESDVIETGNGSADLQSRKGVLVRVKSYSRIKLSRLASDENRVTLEQGSILAKIDKVAAEENFQVTTPTAIAGVRGTIFSVELSDNKSTKIRVMEGKVALTPHVETLGEFSEKEIKSNKELEKIASFLEKNEVVIEQNSEGSIKPEVADLILLVNTRLETAKKENSLKKVDLEDDLKSLEGTEPVAVASSPVDNRDKNEIATLVGVNGDVMEKALNEAAESSSPGDDRQIASVETASLNQNYKENFQEALKELNEEAKEQGLKTDEDIRNYYNILEVVNRKDGTQSRGAVVTQVGDRLILHSTEGVIEIPINDVDFIEIETFKIKTKNKNEVR